MERIESVFEREISRRRFVASIGTKCAALAAAGLPLSAAGLSEPKDDDRNQYVTQTIRNYRTSAVALSGEFRAAPMDLTFMTARNLIAREFSLRWAAADALSLLDPKTLRSLAESADRPLVLDLPMAPQDQKNLFQLCAEFDVSVIPDGAEIKPIQLRPHPIVTPSTASCGKLILQIVAQSAAEVFLTNDAISALMDVVGEPVKCASEALRENNNRVLYDCLVKLASAILAKQTLDLLRDHLGKQAYKRLVKLTTQTLAPVVGFGFFVWNLALNVKANSSRLRQSCS